MHTTYVRGEVLDGALVTNEEAGVSAEPVRLQPRPSQAAEYIEIVGSPDIVVEIVSDSSVTKDTRLLRDAYARAGIREYWLIDARGAEIRFEILILAGDAFRSAGDPSAPQESRVFGGRWSLTRGHNRAGRFTYSLHRVS